MDNLLDLLIEPLSHAFMQRALLMALLVAIVCSIFSCFLILKGWSLMGDAISHALLPGLVIAYIAGLPLALGALTAGLFCAGSTGFIKNHSRVKEDAVMGIIFSGMFAAGLVMLTKVESDIHLMHILFGNVLGITQQDLLGAGTLAILCSAIMLIKRKDFMAYCFDPAHAAVIGLPVKALHFTLLGLLAVTIVTALKAAGIILVIAMLIAPGAIGFILSKSFDRMMIIAVAVSVASCFAGTIISFHIDAATAPLIIVIQAIFFILALIIEKITSHAQIKRANT